MSESASASADKYADYSREQLLAEINRLKKNKKYGLVWEHKKEQVIEDFETQQPYLQEVTEKRIENAPGEPTNLIIEGDNFEALSILNYTHAGKVDVIYIDPPYNTGKGDFVFNDDYVDPEDPFCHSKWLSFMESRLRLAKRLLKDDGVIFVSIDDYEQSQLKVLCDELFGSFNFICEFIWRRSGAGGLRGIFPVTTHEYVLAYAKDKNLISAQWLSPYTEESFSQFKNKDENGIFKTQALYLTSLKQTKNQSYYIELPDGSLACPPSGIGAWRFVEEKYKQEFAKGNILFKETKTSPLVLENGDRAKYNIYTKQYVSSEGSNPSTIFPEEIVKQTRAAQAEQKDLFKKSVFDYAKPSTLVKYLLELVNKRKDILVLDFFAGSGTTGQAALELNKEDGGHRQFILCTNNGDKGPDSVKIAEDITYPRMKTVITGKRQDGSKYSDGILANLRYYKIGRIEKKASIDANRLEIVRYLEDIIQVKENAFEQIEVNEDLALYENSERFVGMVFEPFALEEIIESIKEKNGEDRPVKLYVFSYSRDAFEDNYETDFEIEFVAMPEGLLKTYANIIVETKKEDA